MANEFIARKGLIVLTNGATITGSLNTQGNINASGYSVSASAYTGSFTGPLTGTASWATNAITASFALTTAGTVQNAVSSSYAATASYATYVVPTGLPTGLVSSSGQISYTGLSNTPSGIVSSSTQFKTITDPFTGSFTGSFTGDGSGLTGIASTLIFSGSTSGTDTLNLKTEALIFSGSNGITATVTNNTVTFAAPAGTVTSSGQISYTGLSNIPSGIVSSSTQLPTGIVSSSTQVTANLPTGTVSSSIQIDVRNTTGIATLATTGSNIFTGTQSINDTTNSTAFNNGALIVAGGVGIAKDVNISGSLTVTGLLTAVSMSTQYVTASQLLVADNKIVVSVNDVVRFGGLSVVDSGSSSPTTASIYWDSLAHKFIYENLSGSSYNSALFIAGPVNTGQLGNEVGLTVNRVPVASGDDHIDSRPVSSSIRVDFPSRFTHIEAGLYVTGGVTASAGFTGSLVGSLTGTASWANNAVTSSYVLPTGLPTGIYSSSAQLPTGTISSSTQFNSLTAPFTGSFTGSFTGDGSNLTGIATNLNISGSTSGAGTVALKTQTLIVSGTNGITATVSGQTITISGSNATTTAKGVASFNSTNFTVTGGEVTSNNISINGTNVTLGGTRNITLQQITAQGASTADQVTFNGGVVIQSSLYTTGSNPDVDTGTEIVATVATGSYSAAFFDYYISSASNYRAGTVTSVWQPGTTNIEFTDVSTNDIGNTSGLVMAVDILGDLARLKATVSSDNWVVKTLVRAL